MSPTREGRAHLFADAMTGMSVYERLRRSLGVTCERLRRYWGVTCATATIPVFSGANECPYFEIETPTLSAREVRGFTLVANCNVSVCTNSRKEVRMSQSRELLDGLTGVIASLALLVGAYAQLVEVKQPDRKRKQKKK